MDWIKQRLSEPSSHAAIAAFLTANAPLVFPHLGVWAPVVASVFAALGFAIPEKK